MKAIGASAHRLKALAPLLAAMLALAPSLARADMSPTPELIATLGVFAGFVTAILSIVLELPVVLLGASRLGVSGMAFQRLWRRLIAANVVSQMALWAFLIALPPILFPALNALLGHAGSRSPLLAGKQYPPFVYLALDRAQAEHAIYFQLAWVLIVLMAEAAVVVVEYWFYRKVPKVTLGHALGLAVVANAFSFGVGSLFLPWWDVVP